MVKVLLSMKLDVFMKEIGHRIKDKEEVLSSLQMVIPTKENIKMVKRMVKERTLGKMEKLMMVSGLEVKSVVMEFGEVFMVIVILVNGRIVKQKDTEFTRG